MRETEIDFGKLVCAM